MKPFADVLGPGDRFERLVIDHLLGGGGAGCVYAARDPALDRAVALKVLHDPRRGGIGALGRFEREARVLARLAHPGIVRVHRSGTHADRPFIVMDIVPGQSLASLMPGPRLGDAVVAAIGGDIARALAAAHEAGVLHRDVKPQNIIVSSEGRRAVLVDFGLARDETDASGDLTKTGHVIGTVRYMAPEQIRGDKTAISAATDVWGLGATLYHAAVGRPPFEGEAAATVMAAILRSTPAAASTTSGDAVSVALSDVLGRCLEHQPVDRFADAGSLASALDVIAAAGRPSVERRARRPSGRPRRATRPPASAPAEERPTGPRPALVVAAVLGILAVGVAGFVLARRGARPDPSAPADGSAGRRAAAPDAPSGTVAVTIDAPRPGLVTRDATVRIAGTAPGATELWIDGASVPVVEGGFSIELDLRGDGARSVSVRRTEDGPALARVEVLVDRTAPVLEIDAPEPGALIGRVTVAVAGTVSDASKASVSAGGATVDVGEDGRFRIDVLAEGEGEIEIELTASDTVGNATRGSVQLVRDGRPPTITLESPADGHLTRERSVRVAGRVEDAHLPEAIVAAGERVPIGPDGHFETVLTVAGDGPIEVTARDLAGNEATVAPRVRIDDEPPAVTLEAFPPLVDDPAQTVAVRGTLGEDGCRVMVAGRPATVDGRAFVAIARVDPGANVLPLTATDPAGNVTAVSARVNWTLRDRRGPRSLVVYRDPSYSSTWVTEPDTVAAHFVERGYTQVGARELGAFMQARVDDPTLPRGLCVLSQGCPPDTVVSAPWNDTLLRRYLQAGNSAVSFATGGFQAVGAEGTKGTFVQEGWAILGIGIARWGGSPTDTAKFAPGEVTAEGKAWGLTHDGWSIRPAKPDSVTTVLATDPVSGGASAWFKNFDATRPASGFVCCWTCTVAGDDVPKLVATLDQVAAHLVLGARDLAILTPNADAVIESGDELDLSVLMRGGRAGRLKVRGSADGGITWRSLGSLKRRRGSADDRPQRIVVSVKPRLPAGVASVAGYRLGVELQGDDETLADDVSLTLRRKDAPSIRVTHPFSGAALRPDAPLLVRCFATGEIDAESLAASWRRDEDSDWTSIGAPALIGPNGKWTFAWNEPPDRSGEIVVRVTGETPAGEMRAFTRSEWAGD